jgi:hypothetical protein
MADSTFKFGEYYLFLDASVFSFCMALLRDEILKRKSELGANSRLLELAEEVKARHLDHDWYNSIQLGDILSNESDSECLIEVIGACIQRIQCSTNDSGDVSADLYQSLEGAKFSRPFEDRVHWTQVVYPFLKIVLVPLQRHRLRESNRFLKVMGWCE